MISINRQFIDDPFYRYKMDKITVTIKNKKTNLINLSNISNTLKIDPKIMFRYITSRLGTFGQEKKESYIISGVFDADKIQNLIYDFIDIYILCKKCKFPEVSDSICKACGFNN